MCVRQTNRKTFIVLAMHVDDMILMHNDDSLCDNTVSDISSEFETTDLGEPKLQLGMRLQRRTPRGAISIDQSSFISDLLIKFQMNMCKPALIPHLANVHLSSRMCPSTQKEIDAMHELIGPY